MKDLWKHQEDAINRAKDLDSFALFFQMGTGKTRTAIETLNKKNEDAGKLCSTIVFCPPIVCSNWVDEYLKFSGIQKADIVVLNGSEKNRINTFILKGYDNHFRKVDRIFITNYEALLMKDLYKRLLDYKADCIIFDESHKLKSPSSKRSKLACTLANPNGEWPAKAPFKLLLTGSPVLNSPMDIFQQFKIMDGGKSFGHNFFSFRAKYFYDKNVSMPKHNYFPNWQVRPNALEEINRKIFENGMVVKKEDCLDLPPLIKKTIKVQMNSDQKRIYTQLAKEYVAVIEENKTVSATLAMVKGLRLMQIASGFVSVDGEDDDSPAKMKPFKNHPKGEALRELLEEIAPNHKVLVWAAWKQNYNEIKEICSDLGLKYVEVHGGISSEQKQKNIDEFKTIESCRVFIGNAGSGGIGINLINAPVSIYFSRTFSLEHALQSEARNHRGGAEIHDKITHIDLVCEGTIDESVCEALTRKEKISDKLLNSLVKDSLVK